MSSTVSEAKVTAVSWQGIDVDWYGEPDRVSWLKLANLAKAATNLELRPVYAELLRQALAMAARKKMVRVFAANLNGHCLDRGAGTFTWAAQITDPAGGHDTTGARRLVGAAWGQTDRCSYAEREVAEAFQTLEARGYDVLTRSIESEAQQ